MAPLATDTGEFTAAANATVDLPAGAASGHVCVVVFAYGNDIGPEAKAGWTLEQDILSGSSDSEIAAYYRVLDGTEGASVAFNHTGTPNGLWWSAIYDTIDTATPVLTSSGRSAGSATSQTTTAITFSEAAKVLTFSTAEVAGNNGTQFATNGTARAHTEILDLGSAAHNVRLGVSEVDEASAVVGAQYGWTFTTGDPTAQVVVAFKPAAAAPVEIPLLVMAPQRGGMR